MSETEQTLDPCKRCGSDADFGQLWFYGGQWVVHCVNPDCAALSMPYWTKKAAAEDWTQRQEKEGRKR